MSTNVLSSSAAFLSLAGFSASFSFRNCGLSTAAAAVDRGIFVCDKSAGDGRKQRDQVFCVRSWRVVEV